MILIMESENWACKQNALSTKSLREKRPVLLTLAT